MFCHYCAEPARLLLAAVMSVGWKTLFQGAPSYDAFYHQGSNSWFYHQVSIMVCCWSHISLVDRIYWSIIVDERKTQTDTEENVQQRYLILLVLIDLKKICITESTNMKLKPNKKLRLQIHDHTSTTHHNYFSKLYKQHHVRLTICNLLSIEFSSAKLTSCAPFLQCWPERTMLTYIYLK